MPTGAGKTMTALEQVVDFVRAHTFQGYIIWIVDSSELAEQAFASFNKLWMLRGDRPTNLYRFLADITTNLTNLAHTVLCSQLLQNTCLQIKNKIQKYFITYVKIVNV